MIPKFAGGDSPFVSRFVCNFNFPPALFAIRHSPLPSPFPWAAALSAFCGGHKGSNAAGACTE